MVSISRKESGALNLCIGVPFWGTKLMTLIWEASTLEEYTNLVNFLPVSE